MKSDKVIHSTIESKKNSPFTLIEILVVISIIAILMALLMPAIGAVTKSANKAKARELGDAIVTAIAEYELEYSIPPEFSGLTIGSDPGKLSEEQYDILVQVLASTNMPSPPAASGAADSKELANHREVQFLEPPNKFTKKGYVDPWGKRFIVLLDYDYDNEITIKNNNKVKTTNRAIVYSCGPNKTDDNGSDDDVCSWE